MTREKKTASIAIQTDGSNEFHDFTVCVFPGFLKVRGWKERLQKKKTKLKWYESHRDKKLTKESTAMRGLILTL